MTYAEAIQDILQHGRPSKMRLMEAFMGAPEHTLSQNEITVLLNYKHSIGANSIVGQLGAQIYKRTGLPHPDPEVQGEFEAQSYIFIRGHSRDSSYGFKLRPHIVDALRELGIGGSENPVAMPEEFAPDRLDSFVEGALRSALVNAYERDPRARLACLSHYGYECACCGLNMKELYDLVADFAHVHHLKPLAEIRQSYQVDPISDLRPVCPNCHAVIHLSEPPLSIEDVRVKLKAY